MRKVEKVLALTWHSNKKKKVTIGHEKDTHTFKQEEETDD